MADFQGQNFKDLKNKLPAFKSHLHRVNSRFENSLERNDLEKVKDLFHDTNEKVTTLVSLMDAMELALTEEDETIHPEEKTTIIACNDEVLETENKIGKQYDDYIDQHDIKIEIPPSIPPQSTQVYRPPMVKLSGLDPPTWDGQKTEFYTWKERFNHIMHQAHITDEMVQLSWLLRDKTMPKDFQTMICDCKSISSAWERLEERIPKAVVQREVIKQFEQIKPLSRNARNPTNLRQLAHEISLFCRRMEDLGLKQDSDSVLAINKALECLDADTALRYSSYGGDNESLEGLSAFLRSEATALERTGNFPQQNESIKPSGFQSRQRSSPAPRSNFNAISHGPGTHDASSEFESRNNTYNCSLGCGVQHRLIDCKKYRGWPIEDRKQFIGDERRCFICLGTHMARNCTRSSPSGNCKYCRAREHHWTLCFGQEEVNDKPIRNSSETNSNWKNPVSHSNAAVFNQVKAGRTDGSSTLRIDYSPLVIVEVQTRDNKWVKANLFLDGGSNHSLVRKGFAKSLKLPKLGSGTIRFGVAGGAVHEEKSQDFNLKIRPITKKETFDITVTAVSKPCHDVTPIPSSVFKEHGYLKCVQDQIPIGEKTVDILVGRDYAPLIQTISSLRSHICPDNHPSVAFTPLGCYLYGGMIKTPKRSFNHVVKINCFSKVENEELKNFFHGEVLGVQPTSLCVCSDAEIAESAFIKHARATTKINDNGRVCVQMPWKQGFPEKLPNNFDKAFDQMKKREQQLVKNGKLEEYNLEIKSLLERGVVKKLNPAEAELAKLENAWYLNHRIVERPDKSSTKLRVVFDSASPFRGVCLNDGLEKGPNFTNSLFRCFIAWRADHVALAGDISKMFNQIEMTEHDQKFHRFLWRFGESSPPMVFQWLRVLFGDKSSPDLASFTIKMLADKHKADHPTGAAVLNQDTYIDDVGHSVSDHVLAKEVIEDVDHILKSGKFSIKAWNSNHPEVDQNPEEKLVDVLGHVWDKTQDVIESKLREFSLDPSGFSKRKALGVIMKLWDPLGYLLPVTMQYRIDLQAIWEAGYDWDQCLPDEMLKIWQSNSQEIHDVVRTKLARCLKPANTTGPPQLHAFSDGGDQGFGTCAFLRWPTADGVKLTFVAAKGFVAPLKHKTTPRKELMGAVAMSRLTDEIIKALPYDVEFKRFWIDSKVVLFWLSSLSSKFKPFVASRIQEFQDTHMNLENELKYIPSHLNPADSLTKPISVSELTTWHEGPDFLKEPQESWPSNDLSTLHDLSQETLEKKPLPKRKKYRGRKQMHAVKLCSPEDDLGTQLAENFSSWMDLVRSTGWMRSALQHKSFSNQVIHMGNIAQHLENTKNCIFKICQKSLGEDFENTRKKYWKLDLAIDSQGLVKISGRLDKTELSDEMKHPIVLPSEHPLVRLLGEFYHKKLLHQGYRVILANMKNDGIVLIGGKELLKSIASRCIFCRIRRRKLLLQRMGELPSFRVQPRKAPFSSVAVDFFGFLRVKQSRNVVINASVLIVTCATTRCIHLELCLALDTNSFLRAWRRFVSIRGVHPEFVFSDGGTTFQAGEAPIKEWINNWNRQSIENEMMEKGTRFDWKYNVPTASHMNGVVESLINSVRKGLDASVVNYSRCLLSFEEWTTVLSEITYIVNSRPLFPDGNPLEFNCITGNSLLHPFGQPQVAQSIEEKRFNPRDMLKVAEDRVDVFWNTWIKHMPPQLLLPNKWFRTRNNLQVGDFVINLQPGFKGGNAPRGLWKKALVHEVNPGCDGLVRSVTIKDSAGNLYKRPIHKLCLIATKGELESGLGDA